MTLEKILGRLFCRQKSFLIVFYWILEVQSRYELDSSQCQDGQKMAFVWFLRLLRYGINNIDVGVANDERRVDWSIKDARQWKERFK